MQIDYFAETLNFDEENDVEKGRISQLSASLSPESA